MPDYPAAKRLKNATVSKDELDKMAPGIRRNMEAVNKAANKFKWGDGVKGKK